MTNFVIVYNKDDNNIWFAKIYTHNKELVGVAGPGSIDAVVQHVDRLTSRYKVLDEMPSLLKGFVLDEEKE